MGNSPGNPRHCRECGRELSAWEQFCKECGAPPGSDDSQEQGREYESLDEENRSSRFPWTLVGLFYSLTAVCSIVWWLFVLTITNGPVPYAVALPIPSVLATTPALLTYLKVPRGLADRYGKLAVPTLMYASVSVCLLVFSVVGYVILSLNTSSVIDFLLVTGIGVAFWVPGAYAGLFFSLLLYHRFFHRAQHRELPPGAYAGRSLSLLLYRRLRGQHREQQEQDSQHGVDDSQDGRSPTGTGRIVTEVSVIVVLLSILIAGGTVLYIMAYW